MIVIRRAGLADAAAIGAVHVAAWRSTYPGLLPDNYLANLSPTRLALHYKAAVATGGTVYVAASDTPGPRIVGFVTAGAARTKNLGEGEIETLYVLDDWRERGLGRRLMRAAAAHLAGAGCGSAFVWVLRDNPNRWFYERLSGRPAAEATIQVGGAPVVQMAYVWSPIEKLVQATSAAP